VTNFDVNNNWLPRETPHLSAVIEELLINWTETWSSTDVGFFFLEGLRWNSSSWFSLSEYSESLSREMTDWQADEHYWFFFPPLVFLMIFDLLNAQVLDLHYSHVG
jgi:hypothetical protein